VRPTRSTSCHPSQGTCTDNSRLRLTDVKAGHYERKAQALEQARDEWEAKYEEMAKKHGDLQKELQELEQSMGNI
jgi:tropomyosin